MSTQSKKQQTAKPTVGIFKFSCCAGCQFELIYFQKFVLETFGAIDLRFCKMATSGGDEEGPFDIALIEGTITESSQVDQLKKIRQISRKLYAIGSCAVNGGIPAIKTMRPELDVERSVYKNVEGVHSIKPGALDEYVKVDGYIKGCPVGDNDFHELITSLFHGKRPEFNNTSVCMECKRKGNTCVLVAYGDFCMGPVTNAGCGALCPTYERPCYACWGPMDDPNAPALARQFEKMGATPDDIIRRFTMFASVTIAFRKGAELYESP